MPVISEEITDAVVFYFQESSVTPKLWATLTAPWHAHMNVGMHGDATCNGARRPGLVRHISTAGFRCAQDVSGTSSSPMVPPHGAHVGLVVMRRCLCDGRQRSCANYVAQGSLESTCADGFGSRIPGRGALLDFVCFWALSTARWGRT